MFKIKNLVKDFVSLYKLYQSLNRSNLLKKKIAIIAFNSNKKNIIIYIVFFISLDLDVEVYLFVKLK